MKTVHRGKILKGAFHPANNARWLLELATFKDGSSVEVTIQKPRKHRSGEQNRYYFGVVILLISEKTGFSKQEAHDEMRRRFLSEEVRGSKVTLTKIKSTTELSTVEFMEFIEEIRQFAAEFLDLNIPDPEDCEF